MKHNMDTPKNDMAYIRRYIRMYIMYIYIYTGMLYITRIYSFFFLVIATQGKKGITIKRIKTSLISSKNYKFYSNERFFFYPRRLFLELPFYVIYFLPLKLGTNIGIFFFWYFADRDGLILYLI